MTCFGLDPDTVTEALGNVRRRLLDARTTAGHWEGKLSSSALSTATASFALWLYSRHPAAEMARRDVCTRLSASGVRWLADHQNRDGGWGDTTGSISNISTTTLCWATLRAAGGDSSVQTAIARAEGWLERAIEQPGRGSNPLSPAQLAEAIARRYGKDRTFSVPILTLCALAGQLGPGNQTWKLIPQLPFELAALPQSWFRFVHLPVVSYALPALIAMGQARHHHLPTRNPITGFLRRIARARTLSVLKQIQPPGGGFLEATPLTSFVVMCLIAIGEVDHPVTSEGIEFLFHSIRLDGSWPIDTNLATWVTTLSLNSMAGSGSLEGHLSLPERTTISAWLLKQQYRTRHLYTGAAPGGWAWTPLPGGVPDADDTAGALVALHNLGEVDNRILDAATAGIRWLLDLQNSDGGIPTFCRGWGHLPFDRSSPELTAHAIHAWNAWRGLLPAPLGTEVDHAVERALHCLRQQQKTDGCWIPLWFGNQAAPEEENPVYGTARVLLALSHCSSRLTVDSREMVAQGVRWLLAAQNPEGGWGGAPGVPSSVEETGHALQGLLAGMRNSSHLSPPTPTLPRQGGGSRGDLEQAIGDGIRWLIQATHGGQDFSPTPLGLYFARLWYSEKLYPLIAMAGALSYVSLSSKSSCDPATD